MTTIIVCGGRSYGLVPRGMPTETRRHDTEVALRERARLVVVLDAAVERLGLSRVVAGDATGADNFAIAWAQQRGIDFVVYEANWAEHGDRAGPIRNRAMLDQELPSAVIAFPGSKGTRNMCDIAERAGVRVIKVDW